MECMLSDQQNMTSENVEIHQVEFFCSSLVAAVYGFIYSLRQASRTALASSVILSGFLSMGVSMIPL